MNFDDLQIAWNTQADRPVFAVDESSLRQKVKSRGRQSAKEMNIVDTGWSVTLLFLAAANVAEPIFEGHDFHQIPGSVLYLLGAGYFLFSIDQRRRDEVRRGNTLLEDLDLAIAQLGRQIHHFTYGVFWLIVPMALAMTIGFAYTHHGKPAWIWPLCLFALTAMWMSTHWPTRKRLLPQRQELQAFRERLLREGGSVDQEA
ncbi:hypothetical protein [Algisphaera agarilytica]|uniref:Uncharacterized protein n=1 Tax=Algisphaera agarilytica TaxID=1385975 RepID=A0A7X0H6P6_9BACT|nr:hypothetical protein [Algisphaera agarilytica]MBB6430298.1 hypothetical protein [Algisphaera agarilytica]